jgi:predicted ATPase/class 3 adenylate cyclase
MIEGVTSFGDWLKRRRQALGLTQAELARRVGCAVATIRKIEADERRPSVQIATRLADLLNLAPQDRGVFLQSARAELAPDRLPSPAHLPSSMPSGTVTFLLADIDNSTALWERHPQAMRSASARYHGILRSAIAGHRGSVFKSVGDAVYAVFALPAEALAAALDAQRALQRQAWPAGLSQATPPGVRMALHSGVATAYEGDYAGASFNRAARLLAAACGGQIVLSQVTEDLVRADLPAGIELRDLGEYRLKDLSRPEHIFQLVASDLPADFPPLASAAEHPTNLLLASTPLIGRQREAAVVAQLLQHADCRLLTLTGPGGIGKTRLALRVAADLLGAFVDGVFFVGLASIHDPALVAAAIAQTLGIKDTAGRQALEHLKDALRTRQMLLLLDNFEQVLGAGPQIADLLQAAPGLKVLATSRAVLRLSAEREFAVPPLELPDRAHLPAADALSQYAAVELFIQRSVAVKPDFQITNANAPAVAEICHYLDGLPLAIELAAARSKLFAPAALLQRLAPYGRPAGASLQLLTGGAHDLPPRQQTLRSTIAWSYDLLDVPEQTLFQRLAAFVGGWTVEAAEAVCAGLRVDSCEPALDVLDGLASLVDNSMICRAEGLDGEPRFLVLETIREYALEQLEHSGERELIDRRHTGYYLALAEASEPQLIGPEQARWLERLELERDNLRMVMRRAVEREDIEILARLGAAIWRFWWAHVHFSDWRWWSEYILPQRELLPAWLAAKAVTSAGILAFARGDQLGAIELFEESLARYRAIGDTPGIARTLINLGPLVGGQGDHTRATKLLQEGLLLHQELGDRHGVAIALGNLGDIAYYQGDYSQAQASYTESLALAREVEDSYSVAIYLNNLGGVARLNRDYTQAAGLYGASLALFRELESTYGVVRALNSLAYIARYQGDDRQAGALYLEGLSHQMELEDQQPIGLILAGLAAISLGRGRPERAARLLGASQALFGANASLMPDERADYERTVADTRAQLDAAAWEIAWSAGRALALEQAIAETLGESGC